MGMVGWQSKKGERDAEQPAERSIENSRPNRRRLYLGEMGNTYLHEAAHFIEHMCRYETLTPVIHSDR
jgi:hypothetical protein